ncbi:hypothetical protein C8J55DRAFT_564073 [Lentinula edodes]|uniref:Uncharacterized protein n=1 Tax=Lentinula lateritia TaxID=40482 RepID=A0A9W8ZYJ8_9AGAR|nr:hypothetical protein C8J55DRAFT_564073 [Lentinula edodes]
MKRWRGLQPGTESDTGEGFMDAEEGEIEDVPLQTLNPKPLPLSESASHTDTLEYALDLINFIMGAEHLIEWSDGLSHKAIWMTKILLSCTPKQYARKDHSTVIYQDNSTTIIQELRQLSKQLDSMEKWQTNLTDPTPGPASTETPKDSPGIVSVQASGPVYAPKLRKSLPTLPQSHAREPESPLDCNHPAQLVISLKRDAPQKNFVPRVVVAKINECLSNAVGSQPEKEKIRVTSATKNYKGSIILTMLEHQRGNQLEPLVHLFLDILTNEPLSDVKIQTDEPRVCHALTNLPYPYPTSKNPPSSF